MLIPIGRFRGDGENSICGSGGMVDALVLEASTSVCGFESHLPHQIKSHGFCRGFFVFGAGFCRISSSLSGDRLNGKFSFVRTAGIFQRLTPLAERDNIETAVNFLEGKEYGKTGSA